MFLLLEFFIQCNLVGVSHCSSALVIGGGPQTINHALYLPATPPAILDGAFASNFSKPSLALDVVLELGEGWAIAFGIILTPAIIAIIARMEIVWMVIFFNTVN